MGYYMEMTDSRFKVKKENFKKALESLKSVFVPENMNCRDYIGGKEYPHFSWVDTKTVIESASIGKALEEIRYTPVYNNNGDICNVEFTGQKYGSKAVFFDALAPYVEDGSYIAFDGEDGDAWEWRFNNGKVKQIYA